MKNNENGRSMVEMLGVLAIIGVLSAGGLAGYSKAMYKYRVNETMNQITMIVSNIRTLFGSQNTYDGLENANLKDYGIITPDMYTKDADNKITINNPFKGAVTVAAANGRKAGDGANDKEAFYIEYDNLPAEACVTIVTSDWGAGAGSGLIGVAANGSGGTGAYSAGKVNGGTGVTDGKPNFGTGTLAARLIKDANSAPFTIMQAVEACNGTAADGTSGNASIALKYY